MGTPVPARSGSKGGSRSAPRPISQRRQAPRRQAALRHRRNLRIALLASAVVIVLVAVLVIVKVTGGTSANSGTDRSAAPAAVLSQVSSVPVSTLVAAANDVSAATINLPALLPATATPLTSAGKPQILYIGAEYCPYCAAERWPMVMALSKFGTFQNLGVTKSSSTDTNANTPTFSFFGSTYTSPYLSFVAVEGQDRAGKTLQTPTAAQDKLLSTYDSPPYVSSANAGSIPFVYLAGKYMISGAQLDAASIAGASVTSAANSLTSANDATSRATLAVAGHLIGVMCNLTQSQPAAVCNAVPASLKTGSSTASNQGASTTPAAG